MYFSKRITFFQLQEDSHLTSSESRRSRPVFQQMRHMLQRSYPVLPSLKSLEDYRLCWKTFQKEFDKYLKMNHLVWMSIFMLTWFHWIVNLFTYCIINYLAWWSCKLLVLTFLQIDRCIEFESLRSLWRPSKLMLMRVLSDLTPHILAYDFLRGPAAVQSRLRTFCNNRWH